MTNNSKAAAENAMENNNGMLDRITITQLAIIGSSIEEFIGNGKNGTDREWRINPIANGIANGITIAMNAFKEDTGGGCVQVAPVAEDDRYDDAWDYTEHLFQWDINDEASQKDITSWLIETVSECCRAVCKASVDKVCERALQLIDGIKEDLANEKKPKPHQYTDWNGVAVAVDCLNSDICLVHIVPLYYGLKPDGWDNRKDGMFLWDSVDGGIADLREWLESTVNKFFGNKFFGNK